VKYFTIRIGPQGGGEHADGSARAGAPACMDTDRPRSALAAPSRTLWRDAVLINPGIEMPTGHSLTLGVSSQQPHGDLGLMTHIANILELDIVVGDKLGKCLILLQLPVRTVQVLIK